MSLFENPNKHDIISTMSNIDTIIDQAKKDGFKKTNRPSTDIFFVKGKQQVLLKKTLFRSQIPEIQELAKRSSELYDSGINLTRTLEYRFDKHSGTNFFTGLPTSNPDWIDTYLLQDQAIDVDLKEVMYNDNLRKQFANEPQFVFNKFIEDYMVIDKELGQIDDNFNNLFYTPGKITFIDLSIGRFSESKVDTKYALKHFYRNMPYVKGDKNIEIIQAKMALAAANYIE
ncbi:hypothetical protein LJC18_00355 [Lachnospiraceae bacterium OttesenSCG-928-E19]|nr:hypothetical protein [Lachnospiraceae bacterium OttesenSCG-928-E19]